MKKVKFFALMFLAGATLFTSCKKDDSLPASPTISFANNVSSFEIDYATMVNPYTVTIIPTVTADGEISTFTVKKKDANGASSTITVTGSFSGKTTFTETFNLSIDSASSFPLQIIFNVTDKSDQGMEKIFTITRKTGSSGNPINTYPNKTIVSAYLAATSGDQFMDATTGITYRHDASGSNNATFGFISGGGSGADILCSGSSLTFSQKPASWTNGAKLATTSLTAAEFDAITNETELLAAVPATIALNDVQGLNNTTTYVAVLAFEDGGKKGLIKLPSSFTNAQDQSIVISVKVQQ